MVALCAGEYKGPLLARHYFKYVTARVEDSARALAFQAYVTDALQMLTETTAQGFGKGAYLNVRFHELINPKPTDTRSGEEIKSMLLRKLKELGHEST